MPKVEDVEGLFSPWHLLVIFGVALLVLGPHDLPTAARRTGALMRDLRRFQSQLRQEFENVFDDESSGMTSPSSADHSEIAGTETPNVAPPDSRPRD
jgi:Sec-independent protein translocase protein TatA